MPEEQTIDKPSDKKPWWFRLVSFLMYWGPLSVLVMASSRIRTEERFASLELAGKKGIVLFIIEVALFLIVSLVLENPYWKIESGELTGMGIAAIACGFVSLIYSISAGLGFDLRFPGPIETWAINLKI